MKHTHTSAALALTALLALAAPSPAQALQWEPIEGHDGLVLATCADGSQVLSGLTDSRRNRFAFTPVLDDDGVMTGAVLVLKYAGDFVHSTTGRTVSGSGTDRVVMDFVAGTDSHTGNRWTVTVRGEGWVVKEAGRITYSLEDGAVLDYSGVDGGGWERLCPVFGVPA
ncbi:MAG: hypothetical protein ACKOVB_14380 [Terrabacter sp.]